MRVYGETLHTKKAKPDGRIFSVDPMKGPQTVMQHNNMVDEFYPVSAAVRGAATHTTLAAIGFDRNLLDHLAAAQQGDPERESRLINRLGQIRRVVPHLPDCAPEIRDIIRASVVWLRSVGRTVDFKNEDPALWISRRGGGPRW